MKIDYNHMLDFAKEKIGSNSRIDRYSFRDRYEHTLRVMKWAERLHKEEGGDLEVLIIASIFHDVGWSDYISHGIASKEIADEYLTGIGYDETKKEKVLEAIEHHCNKGTSEKLCEESYLLMDADILDEVGAISIIWDAMASTYEDETSYQHTYERIKKYSSKLKDRKHCLNTKTGRNFYEQRLVFIDNFIKELEFELSKNCLLVK